MTGLRSSIGGSVTDIAAAVGRDSFGDVRTVVVAVSTAVSNAIALRVGVSGGFVYRRWLSGDGRSSSRDDDPNGEERRTNRN